MRLCPCSLLDLNQISFPNTWGIRTNNNRQGPDPVNMMDRLVIQTAICNGIQRYQRRWSILVIPNIFSYQKPSFFHNFRFQLIQ